MALVPPVNNAGLPIPAIPANPPSLSDIANARDYLERLILSKGKCLLSDHHRWQMRPTDSDLGSILATRSEIRATNDEIGAAELFLHETVLKTSLGGAAAPPWLDVFVNTLNDI
jgi:hypothetical protein